MTAEFWQYDARLGRRFNIDPKPNPSISNYACFNNNPILFVDVRGDTTSLYDKLGNSLGTINDNLANQTHFLNSKADYDKLMADNKGKSNNDIANAARGASIAFYDANTENQMKKAFEKSPNSEIFFAMVFKSSVSKQLTLEICKSCVAVNGGSDDKFIQGFRRDDLKAFVKATESKYFNVFLTGHSHFKNVGKSNPEVPSSLSYKNTYTTWGTGKTVFEVYNTVDYTMYLKQPHPLILLSTKGITTYRGYKEGEIIPSDEYGNINFDRGTTKKW